MLNQKLKKKSKSYDSFITQDFLQNFYQTPISILQKFKRICFTQNEIIVLKNQNIIQISKNGIKSRIAIGCKSVCQNGKFTVYLYEGNRILIDQLYTIPQIIPYKKKINFVISIRNLIFGFTTQEIVIIDFYTFEIKNILRKSDLPEYIKYDKKKSFQNISSQKFIQKCFYLNNYLITRIMNGENLCNSITYIKQIMNQESQEKIIIFIRSQIVILSNLNPILRKIEVKKQQCVQYSSQVKKYMLINSEDIFQSYNQRQRKILLNNIKLKSPTTPEQFRIIYLRAQLRCIRIERGQKMINGIMKIKTNLKTSISMLFYYFEKFDFRKNKIILSNITWCCSLNIVLQNEKRLNHLTREMVQLILLNLIMKRDSLEIETNNKTHISKQTHQDFNSQLVLNQQIEILTEFLSGKRKKINIWTYLFKEVQLSIDRILRMCEIEQKLAFCQGVRETLKQSLKSLDKIEHKIKLESEQKPKNCAWDVTFVKNKTLDQILQESGFEQNFIELLEGQEESLVEYKLVNELVQEGKMNVTQAIVLIIRERARIYEEIQQKNENFEMHEIGFQNEYKNLRGNSTPQSALALLNRVNQKIKFIDVSNDQLGEKNLELEKQIKEKQQMAQKRKSIISQQKQKDLKKYSNRVNKVKDKRNFLVQKKCESIQKKEVQKIQKEIEKLELIKKQATANNILPSEMNFLMQLEKQSLTMSYDPKLLQTAKRRQKIVEELNLERRQKQSVQNNEFLIRRQKQILERQEKNEKILKKLEQAEERRKQFLEQKIKQPYKGNKKKEVIDLSQFKDKRIGYFMASILPVKNKLDYYFEILESYNKQLKKIEDIEFRSNSCEFTHKRGNDILKEDIQYESSEEDFEENKKKAKKRNRKKRKKTLQEQETKIENNKLSKYYRFLTRDLEFLEQQKIIKQKLQQNKIQFEQTHNDQPELLEYAELISKDVAKQEKTQQSQKLLSYCTLCKTCLEDSDVAKHLDSIKHNKKHQEDSEEIIKLISENEFNIQRLSILKRKCKKIKRNIDTKSLEYETNFMKNENITSDNKKRLTKLTLDFDVSIQQQKRDYEQIDRILMEIHKIIDKFHEQDLHVLRVSRFVNVFIEFIKTSHFCPKFELPDFIKILDNHFILLQRFCLLNQNRQFMYLTNKIVPIVELLSWSWSQSIQQIICINYTDSLLELLSFLIQHSLSEEYLLIKKNLIEYICYCGMIKKIKIKFMTAQLNNDNSSQSQKLLSIVIKTLKFLESLTNEILLLTPIMSKMYVNILKNMIFIFEDTEVAGCIHLLASILLSGGSFDRTIKDLPPYCLVIGYSVLKILNNLARIDINMFQKILGNNSFNSDQFYHVVLFLFAYCKNYYGKIQDVYQVLQELIICLGFYSLNNKDNQSQLARGTEKHTIIFKFGNLPNEFYSNNYLLKELLFPTLLSIIDDNEINAGILGKALTPKFLLSYIDEKINIFSKFENKEEYELYSIELIEQTIEMASTQIGIFCIEPENILLNRRFQVERLQNVKDLILELFDQIIFQQIILLISNTHLT